MRCHEAREQLGAQRDEHLSSLEAKQVQEHLRHCRSCRSFEQRQRQLDTILLGTFKKIPQSTSFVQESNMSTERIMRAVQQQQKITEQLEHIQQQQQYRIEHMRKAGVASAALGLFILSSIPLLFLVVSIIQSDFALKTLSVFNGSIDAAIILGGYLQTDLTLATKDNRILSGVAFVVVVMMGMWLRLMRPSQEV